MTILLTNVINAKHDLFFFIFVGFYFNSTPPPPKKGPNFLYGFQVVRKYEVISEGRWTYIVFEVNLWTDKMILKKVCIFKKKEIYCNKVNL